jgi:hypothetical protein
VQQICHFAKFFAPGFRGNRAKKYKINVAKMEIIKFILNFMADLGDKLLDRGTLKRDFDRDRVYVNSTPNMNYSDPEFIYD